MLSRACSLTSDRQRSTKAEGCVSVDMETASVAAVGGWVAAMHHSRCKARCCCCRLAGTRLHKHAPIQAPECLPGVTRMARLYAVMLHIGRLNATFI